jgi:RNA binding exosome subunit
MKTIRTIAMFTNHGYHGNPIEVTRVTLYADKYATNEEIKYMENEQIKELRHKAKRMPHRYWFENEKTGYED